MDQYHFHLLSIYVIKLFVVYIVEKGVEVF